MPHTREGESVPYVLGHSLSEQQRLDEQGANLRPFTEHLLRDIGLAPGMRVLDVGCGTGDLTLLAAELVGTSGAVIGLDRSAEVLATARSRADSRGWQQVRFVQGDVATFRAIERVDAVIGRLVLTHQPDPAAVVRHLVQQVRPGGVLAFAEPVMLPELAWPVRPLYTQSIRQCVAALDGAGLISSMGMHLHSIFVEAGVPDPRLRLDGAITAGADVLHARWLTETVRSLLPLMERLGITTAGQAGVDSLEQRLIAEAVASGGTACGFALAAAWATVSSN